MFKIEKNIDLPSKPHEHYRFNTQLEKMVVGDSIFVPFPDQMPWGLSRETARNAAIRVFGKNNYRTRLCSYDVDGKFCKGFRIWRLK